MGTAKEAEAADAVVFLELEHRNRLVDAPVVRPPVMPDARRRKRESESFGSERDGGGFFFFFFGGLKS
eukprot:3497186-Rhodomonas_salina.1